MIAKPSSKEIEQILQSFRLPASAAEVDSYRALVEALTAGHALIDEADDELPAVKYPEREWHRPAPADNPLNAWYVRTDIRGATAGRLLGRTVAIKDNVLVAGVPMMNGTRVLEGYLPPVDATIVTRILDAGGHITGKSVCESYCFSGSSHTSDTGPVRNPHNHDCTAGGSSSGSAALVAAGQAQLAIGCDQGGSIRIPSSFCGIYGMKPTHGLVPYTGILGMGPVIDHVGPMTRNVVDNALLLEVIAGADGLDSRQYAPRPEAYTASLEAGMQGIRIGVLTEGFSHPTSEPDVDAKVRAAAQRLARLGASVGEISVPQHTAGAAIGFAVIQNSIEAMFHSDGCLLYRTDPQVASYLEAQHSWRDRIRELPETVKVMLVTCEFLRRAHGYHYVARGTNQVRRLRAAYDAALQQVDLLLMPTTPMKAFPIPAADAPRELSIDAAFKPLTNTLPFDNTHHPAMSIPCGLSEGLPVGLMLVGRHFQESVIYRVAHAFEQHEDWHQL